MDRGLFIKDTDLISLGYGHLQNEYKYSVGSISAALSSPVFVGSFPEQRLEIEPYIVLTGVNQLLGVLGYCVIYNVQLHFYKR